VLQLLRPFPDELLGSALLRATRDLGLPGRRLMTALKGLPTDTLPILMTRDHGIARAFGMSLEELLAEHTLLPYGVAFMPADLRMQVLRDLLEGDPYLGVAPALAQSSTKFAPYLRLCTECMAADLARFGTTYWHRVHQLPGVSLCVHHGVPLWVSTLRVSHPRRIVLPGEVRDGHALQVGLPRDIALDLMELSYAALKGRLPVRVWPQHYRLRAAELGFGYDLKLLAGGQLAADLRAFYGREFLEGLGLDFDPLARNSPWPARILRGSKGNVTPLRHVLMNVFLNRVKGASKPVLDLFARPQRKRFDWAARELEVLRQLEELKAQCLAAGVRMSLAEMSARVSSPGYLWGVRRHMPAVSAWMDAFKASEFSERKAGGRKRRRHQPP